MITTKNSYDHTPIEALPISNRLLNLLVRNKVKSVKDMMELPEDVSNFPGFGRARVDELAAIHEKIRREGNEFFENMHMTDEKATTEEYYEWSARDFDSRTARKLHEEYGLKQTTIAEWYHVAPQRVSQRLSARDFSHGNWLNHPFTENDREMLARMIDQQVDCLEESGRSAYILKNKAGDRAIVFVDVREVKCFYKNMLPEEFR